MIPDPKRWPSSIDGKGFNEVARKVHGIGLKFGIHVMRGVSTQAVDANSPILDITTWFSGGVGYMESGRQWGAKDIGLTDQKCAWMPHGFMSVDTKLGAGKPFLRSFYHQNAEWGVDFVKHYCIWGDDLNVNEVAIVLEVQCDTLFFYQTGTFQVLKELDRPILYSLGTSNRLQHQPWPRM
ncbi:hypothetical protein IFM89_029451 [Coptis chinensis]|uniref:Alpha-galactosidase n=1 Tax=Coptis chinensis TaxID=261450 RepID=A0A835HZ86_9MAGN|nr:hypothetical protein IFM89_029451 [Coptis chinensis]